MSMNDRLTAYAQIALTILYAFGFFFTAAVVMFGRASVPPEQLRLLDTLFGALTAILTQQSAYWFARQRPGEPKP